jgi:hypothetical protein
MRETRQIANCKLAIAKFKFAFCILHFAILLMLCFTANEALAAKPRVSLELATEQGFPITGAQQWHKLFSDMGVTSLRIRSATGEDQPAIEKLGNDKSPSFRVVGVLTARNVLIVPGGKFGVRDSGAIRKWLDELADQGEAGVTERRSAFGLLPKQLEEVHDDLKQPIDFTTRDLPLSQAVEKLDSRLNVPIEIDRGSKDALTLNLEDELQGVSAGTALAVMLRSAGLVVTPERPAQGTLHYRIGKPIAGRESWPVGWTPEKRPNELLPDLYAFVNVEMSDIDAKQAVDAIAEQLKAPFLYDRGAMAAQQIDLAKVTTKVPSKRSTYSLVLQKVLGQAKLKMEVRTDEADKPFFWITTVRAP